MRQSFFSPRTQGLWERKVQMAPGPSYTWCVSVTSVVFATIGILFFTRKVTRAKSVTAHPTASATVTFSHNHAAKPTAFAVGLLEIAIPRDDRPGGAFSRVMINDACISRAVKEVSSKLIISVRDVGSMPPGRVRAFVSHVYQEVYDAACAARRPYLDVLVLLPREAVSNARGHDSLSALVPESSMTNAAFSDGAPGRDSVTDSQSSKRSKRSWVTKEDVERDPGLQVILSDVFQDYYAANLNAERIRAGSPRVATFSLKDIASKAYRSDYFYAEDATMDIPTFANVACGGTFDRLHGGHKKLLTFAASMCPEGTLTVGVTSDVMLKAKANAHMVASLETRLEGVRQFLRKLNPEMKTRVMEITDPYGPPAKEEEYDAIVVSSETVAGAEKINEIREKKGLSPLAVGVTRRLAAATLSSTFLRENAPVKESAPVAKPPENEARVKQGSI